MIQEVDHTSAEEQQEFSNWLKRIGEGTYTLENPRVSPSLSLSVTLPSERRVEGIGPASAEELLLRGQWTDTTKLLLRGRWTDTTKKKR